MYIDYCNIIILCRNIDIIIYEENFFLEFILKIMIVVGQYALLNP